MRYNWKCNTCDACPGRGLGAHGLAFALLPFKKKLWSCGTIMVVRYKSVNSAAGKSAGPPNGRAQKKLRQSQVLAFRVQSSGCRVEGGGLKVSGLGSRGQRSGVRVKGLGFRV